MIYCQKGVRVAPDNVHAYKAPSVFKPLEFNEKLQELRKQKGLTQEDLACKLYVTRTAVSKWESGRGYPNIDSLKAIASFFSVTVDELLSSGEAIKLAEENGKETEFKRRSLTYALVDLSNLLLLFLPLFASRTNGVIKATSLIFLDGAQPYVLIPYFASVILISLSGIAALILRGLNIEGWQKIYDVTSLSVSGFAVVFLTATLQPYAAIFTLTMLAIKTLMLIIHK